MFRVTIFNGFGDSGGNRLMTAKEALEFVEHPAVMISDYKIWDQRGKSISLGKLRKEAKKEANAQGT